MKIHTEHPRSNGRIWQIFLLRKYISKHYYHLETPER